jgi:hypothetical protein
VKTQKHKTQPVFTTPEAQGFTQDEIDELIEGIERDDHGDSSDVVVLVRPRGRQSLTAPGIHSPLISTRVTPELLEALRARAGNEGISVSELQRRILAEYFASA